MLSEDLILKIKELKLPKGEYIVSGSGILDVLTIRKANDIDLLVSPELFEYLKDTCEWKEHNSYKTTISHPEGKAEAKKCLDFMKEQYTLSDIISSAFIYEDIPFINLKILLEAKKQLNREKDQEDIKNIENYLRGSFII